MDSTYYRDFIPNDQGISVETDTVNNEGMLKMSFRTIQGAELDLVLHKPRVTADSRTGSPGLATIPGRIAKLAYFRERRENATDRQKIELTLADDNIVIVVFDKIDGLPE